MFFCIFNSLFDSQIHVYISAMSFWYLCFFKLIEQWTPGQSRTERMSIFIYILGLWLFKCKWMLSFYRGFLWPLKPIKLSNTFGLLLGLKSNYLESFGRNSLFRMSLFIEAGRYTSRQGLMMDVDGSQTRWRWVFYFCFCLDAYNLTLEKNKISPKCLKQLKTVLYWLFSKPTFVR